MVMRRLRYHASASIEKSRTLRPGAGHFPHRTIATASNARPLHATALGDSDMNVLLLPTQVQNLHWQRGADLKLDNY
ncbi:hypothetical protein [Pseudomonas sp. GD03944]|uniref:hypothetical protein n=1 Tax=Pseudomonas sp. GD03944 TaxID=2975409 RepID=UPI00244B6761|nr:hypothetical protein [Pseudomonas sp. GD03944]MDH1264776.1 hypothetical protein [Pseudomonas sp. GD03944]